MKPIWFFFVLIVSLNSFSQITISGKVTDAENVPLIGATVQFKSKDSSGGTVTDIKGKFSISLNKTDTISLKVSYIGYVSSEQNISDDTKELSFILIEDQNVLKEFEVEATQAIMIIKNDTTEINANAFKTHIDASANDLLDKLPGVNSKDGKLTANGEKVEKILVDGKSFGESEDIKKLINSLPAEAVDKVQIYKDKTEESKESEIDDGKRKNTINIVTKKSFRNSVFGDALIGIADQGRYIGNTFLNYLGDSRKITVSGLFNNISSYGGNYANPVNSIFDFGGIFNKYQLTGNWIENFKSGSFGIRYSFENMVFRSESKESRNYYIDSSFNYNSNSSSLSDINEHRLSIRLKKRIGRLNISLRSNNYWNRDNFSERSFLHSVFDSVINITNQNSTGHNNNFSSNNYFSLNYKIDTNGKAIFLKISGDFSENYNDEVVENNQQNNSDLSSLNYSLKTKDISNNSYLHIGYVHPINKVWRISTEVKYNPNSGGASAISNDLLEHKLIDSLTSSSNVINGSFEAGITVNASKKNKFMSNTAFGLTRTNLANYQWFYGVEDRVKNTFYAPVFMSWTNFTIDEWHTLSCNVYSFTSSPSAFQLRETIDPSDAISPTIGNKDLGLSFDNSLSITYNILNKDKTRTTNVSLGGSYNFNQVTINSIILKSDSLVANVFLNKGTILNTYSNISGKYSFNLSFSHSMPLDIIKSKLNLKVKGGYAKSPFLSNSVKLHSKSYHYGSTIKLVSNISDRIDFNVSLDAEQSFTKSENSFNERYERLRLNTQISYEAPGNIACHFTYIGSINSGDFNNLDIHRIKAGIGKRFGKSKRHKVQINVFDALKQNVNYRSIPTLNYISETEAIGIQRFFLVSYTFKIRPK